MAAPLSRPRPSILLVGPTGSGKTPLGDEIERRGLHGRRCCHFDFGANLRAAASGPAGRYGLSARELAAVRASLSTGALFEANDMAMIVKILVRFVEMRCSSPESLLVLNGLPRHRGQAEGLADIVSVGHVISLEADAAVIRKRIRLDPGRDRAGREDDELDAVVRRLTVFHERTAPLVGYYRERGIPVSAVAVTAGMSAAEMYEDVELLTKDLRFEEFG